MNKLSKQCFYRFCDSSEALSVLTMKIECVCKPFSRNYYFAASLNYGSAHKSSKCSYSTSHEEKAVAQKVLAHYFA